MKLTNTLSRGALFLVVIVTIGLLIMAVAAAGAVILDRQADGLWAKRYARAFPLPAARVQGSFVLYRDVLHRWEAVDRFLDMRPIDAPPGQEIRPRTELREEAYEQLIREVYIKSLAKQENFTVPAQVLEANIQALLDQASSTLREVGIASSTVITPPTVEDMNTYLLGAFGWTFDQFRDQVILPALREEGLAQIILTKNGVSSTEWQAQIDRFLQSDKVRRYLKF